MHHRFFVVFYRKIVVISQVISTKKVASLFTGVAHAARRLTSIPLREKGGGALE